MQAQTNRKILGNRLQRQLRNNATDAERRLWRELRGRQLEGCKFRRQHPFGDYILDFACLERKVVVELDGGQHADNAAHDAIRSRALEKAGFTILRFWNNEVFGNIEGVVEVILNALARQATPSPPNPPLEGEGLKQDT
ncbi:endonuclease domain-containing protein [Pseudoxanthomonas mexicana]|uniref:endonuclease domain-containing protein n=1 Tax=Pseudoxanthomonas mexicana TaxID=128785 RepID=UPI00398AAE5B